MNDDKKYWPTHSSKIRHWIKTHDELFPLRDRITKESRGKFPCCGDLKQEYKVAFFRIFESSLTLQLKLKTEGIDYVAIVFGDQLLKFLL